MGSDRRLLAACSVRDCGGHSSSCYGGDTAGPKFARGATLPAFLRTRRLDLLDAHRWSWRREWLARLCLAQTASQHERFVRYLDRNLFLGRLAPAPILLL